MRELLRDIAAISSVAVLVSCAAMLVPATSDPAKKLSDAKYLFDEAGRALPAEQLIREAIEIYQDRNDDLGLANAYRYYGFFFTSEGVTRWQSYYEKHGFIDKTATYNDRYKRAIEYFQKAADIYSAHDKFDALTNVYLHIGSSYEFMNDKLSACSSYEKCLFFHHKWLEVKPGDRVEAPPGFKTFEEYVLSIKKRLGCSSVSQQ